MKAGEVHDGFQHFRFESGSDSNRFVVGIEHQLLNKFITLGVTPEQLDGVGDSRVVLSQYFKRVINLRLTV